jgi:hypothetical protein
MLRAYTLNPFQELVMFRSFKASVLLALVAFCAGVHAQAAAPAVRINPPDASASAPSQPDPAYRPAERDKAMAQKPSNGCSCASNNRCYHSRDFNYCVAEDGRRVYSQRYWGQ